MTSNRFQLGMMGVVMLVLLRIAVGWHFLYAGIDKFTGGDFTSEGFLGQAKGPVGEKLKDWILADTGIHSRLDPAENAKGLEKYFEDFAAHYGFDKAQRESAELRRKHRQNEITAYLEEREAEITEFRHNDERLQGMKLRPTRNMPFEQKRLWDNQQNLSKQSKEWLKEVDRLWDEFKSDLNTLLTPEQQEQSEVFVDPPSRLGQIDKLIMWSNVVIGVCLILGLFTRIAAVCGGLFLASIVAAQPDWPGLYPAPHPSAGRSFIVNKEFIEMMALFVLAATPVGRWGGLDYFIHHLVVRPVFYRRDKR